ncbi:hypothetical protein BEP19_02920 [Ammoniphilus oxalaticus]|uniref:GGDEF domain-containing protein n=1 Tax=Ammoniphilus oxalaticus TaxID=66863 RepID=A0A419SNM3_9BACL|nr:GGDEF domain-containing protein [Ammoniphilus oxalaticus]RKD25896.1 hypothetical protein BEP19_02920 [Ammoniphilus oxalaticus]
MNKILNKNNLLFILLTSILLLVLSFGLFLFPRGQGGAILYTLGLFIGLVGVIGGAVAALGFTLLLFFMIGSVMFWTAFTETPLFNIDISFFVIIVWMIGMLLISLLTGQMSSQLKAMHDENQSLREQIRTLVAIDPTTGFDNKERMLVELELEFNRSKRYKQTFTFVLMKINHLDQFEKLYGVKEMNRLFQHFAKGIHRCVRASDQKYRPEKDMFALILPYTEISDVKVVIQKLEKELKVYQLENRKYTTLTIEYGYIGLDERISQFSNIYELAKEQVSAHVS